MEKPAPQIDRNTNIKELLKNGKVPMLPFEAVTLEEQMGMFKERQVNLSVLLRSSMEDSSETWHDNAPAEAIASESNIVFAQASKALRTQTNSEIVDYPRDNMDKATLGSLVSVSFGKDEEPESILLTGAVRSLHEEIAKCLPEGTDCATIESPLGEALFGANAGDTVSYRVNESRMLVQVHQIVQLTPALLQ